ncbi:uncharacterized protein KRP23_2609 [Phytophthora ramorum]|uniref:uncharacterized protein n=1 Tax=Phytophthora ramorum TaxID=164328 RepID=UPI0030AD5D30|nr:hypothetical protein KRP23_2609 [Phytophthora ramorum]
MNHLDDMVETPDGQKLLQLLFGDDGNQGSTDKSANAPSQQDISALFSVMDTNRDNEIEWAEYLRFLQQKQQQFLATAKDDEKAVQSTAESPEVPSPQLEQKRELRKKNREDRRLPPLSSGAASSNQNEFSSKSHLLKQTPSEPKRPSKTSASEEKLLKLQYSNQEQRRLQQQVSSLESILALERKREQSTISATPADLTESEVDIKHILTDLLEAVARLSEPDAWESRIEGLNGSNVDATHVRTDSIVDPISPSTAANYVEQENVLGDDLNAAGSDDVERPTTTDDTTDCCMNLPADVHNEILEDSELDAVRCVLESIQDQVVARAHDEVFGSVTKDADKLSAPPSDGGVDIPTQITDSGYSLNEPATASEEEGALQQPSEGESGNESDSTTNELEEGAVHQQGIDADQHSPLDQHSGDSQEPEAVDTRTRSVDPDQPDASSNGGRENNVDVASNSHGVSEHEVVDPTDPDGEANGQILIDADLSAAFDTDTTAGNFAVPNDSDSDDPGNEDNSSDEAGSSIDSADLMLEADEMAILQDTSTNPSVVTRAARHRKTERLDSVTLLSDLDQLDAQSTKNPPRHRENH